MGANPFRRAAQRLGGSPLPGLSVLRGALAPGWEPTEQRSIPPHEFLLDGWATSAGVAINPETAMRIADVFACVRVLTEEASSLPLATYRRVGAAGRERVSGGFIEPLLRKPAPYMTQQVFVSTILGHLLLWGNAYVAKLRNGPRVVALMPITPSRVSVRLRGGEPEFELAQSESDPVSQAGGVFTSREILHFKAFSTDGICGRSVIAQSRDALGVSKSLEEFAGAFMQNDATPGGTINLPQGRQLSAEKAKELRKDFNARHQGPKKAGAIAVLEDGATYNQLGLPLADAQFVEQRKLSSTEIARIFRIPAHMIDAESGSTMTYQNVEQSSLNFLVHSLRPWLVAIEQTLACDPSLYPPNGSTYPEFLLDALLRADARTRADIYDKAEGRWMTRNEIRQRENLPALPGGDSLDAPSASRKPAAEPSKNGSDPVGASA